jgi:hypothetical protein
MRAACSRSKSRTGRRSSRICAGGVAEASGTRGAWVGTGPFLPRRRPRPPRRPRCLRRLAPSVSCALASVTGATVGGGSAVSGANRKACVSSGGAACASGSACGASAEGGVAEGISGTGAPKRVKASTAFVRHCARRKRSAAVVYHCTAEGISPAFSRTFASSKATMPSCVRSYRSVNCAAGSGAAFALRMRAWICRQSAMGVHCSSRKHTRPAEMPHRGFLVAVAGRRRETL